MRRRMLATILAVALTGCAAGPSPTPRPKVDPNLITRDEIQAQQFTNAYDAVKTLRANWLHVRGGESVNYPLEVQVYLNDTHIGDISALQTIASPPIQFIRFYSGQEASAKWGVDHGRGAIVVSTKVSAYGVPKPPA